VGGTLERTSVAPCPPGPLLEHAQHSGEQCRIGFQSVSGQAARHPPKPSSAGATNAIRLRGLRRQAGSLSYIALRRVARCGEWHLERPDLLHSRTRGNADSPIRPYADTPIRRDAHTPIRRYADTPIRPYAHTPIRRYAHTPIRPYADTPIRRYAHTPIRPYADTPIRRDAHTPRRPYAETPIRRDVCSPRVLRAMFPLIPFDETQKR
jgi:hypothetical protein